ncbi:MAG: uracil phosphoribosyltransferase [Sphingobacteriales bacterium]|nr:MAG: uracil phosphoribosyltransferase [Sphingobacteriales bacterium]
MIHDISQNNPLVGQIMSELRDVSLQSDRMRFRRNLERLGEMFAYEIGKRLPAEEKEITTPLGTALCTVLSEQPVLATILRAGLPLHQGLLNVFDRADNAFISAYRKHHKNGQFTIKLEYLSSPELDDRIVILADPMLATGASMVLTLEQLYEQGAPKEMHIVTAIACTEGIAELRRHFPNISIWTAAIDEELTAKGYIVPGLGDAGDLSFGEKTQD